MKNIMLDLETMGTESNAAIVAIGACEFDPHGTGLFAGYGTQFYVRVSLESSMAAGLTVSAGTILWWLQQSEAARKETFEGSVEGLKYAIERFEQFVGNISRYQPRDVAVWGNGATFDNVIIRSAFKAVGLPVPWSFRNDKCYRTIKNLVPADKLPPWERTGTAHNALSDAITQALYLQKCYRVLGL